MGEKCKVSDECDIPIKVKGLSDKFDEYVEDERQRHNEFKGKVDQIYFGLIGDKAMGQEGFIASQNKTHATLEKQLSVMQDKLDKDHDLLWWNRKLEEMWSASKRPIYISIFVGVIGSVFFGFHLIEYLKKKFGF